jgi:ABC-type transport system involved in Fe-S cluster assembly fused permease/ATPase subunit
LEAEKEEDALRLKRKNTIYCTWNTVKVFQNEEVEGTRFEYKMACC